MMDRDFVEYLGPDTSFSVFTLLGDPADILRASSVSRSWHRFIIANGFIKILCCRMCPELSNFTRVMEVKSSQVAVDVGPSNRMEWETLERVHRAYSYLSHCLISPTEQREFVLESVGASSTDNDPDENIQNTLVPTDRVFMRPSYWSSGGKSDPEVPEALTYRLCSKLCIVNEIKIQPFKAYFQYGNPIYSAKAVQFRMGHSKLTQETGDGYATSPVPTGDNFVWMYISPEFPMVQENVLQSFKLPRPVICLGDEIIQIELLGRVQKQESDDLYYICVCHVKVIGCRLTPIFDVDILERSSEGNSILRYFPDAQAGASPAGAPPEDEAMEVTAMNSGAGRGGGGGGGWNFFSLTAFLGPGAVPDDSDSDEEEMVG